MSRQRGHHQPTRIRVMIPHLHHGLLQMHLPTRLPMSATESSEAGSPSQQLSHEPAERRDSIASQHSIRGSHAEADSDTPVATSGTDSYCSDAGLGEGSSASFEMKQPAAAAASAEDTRNSIRGTSQEVQAEDLFAPWYGAPPPPLLCQPTPASNRCAAACFLRSHQPLMISRTQLDIQLQTHDVLLKLLRLLCL